MKKQPTSVRARAKSNTGVTRKNATKKRAFEIRLERFADEYLIDLNGAAAAVRAGYSEHTADVKASQLLARADVQEMIEQRELERSKRTKITADNVLRDMYEIATADASEYSEIRVGCCRYCYGKDHRYQRTPRELEIHREEWEAKVTKANKGESPERLAELLEEFDPEGGSGYDKSKAPIQGCPECFGEGIARAVFKNTSTMSPAARRAFGGVKSKEKSMEVVVRDQDAALFKVADHLGMFKKRVEVKAGDGTDTKPERAHILIPLKAIATDDLLG